MRILQSGKIPGASARPISEYEEEWHRTDGLTIHKLKWEVYNIPQIVVSEESYIAFNYKSIEQIPKLLREFKMWIEKEDYKEYGKMTHEEILEIF